MSDIHLCHIHGEPFDMEEEGGCSNCMEEWDEIESEEECKSLNAEPSGNTPGTSGSEGE